MDLYPRNGKKFLYLVKRMRRNIASLESEAAEYRAALTAVSSPRFDRESVDGGKLPAGLEAKIVKLAEYGRKIFEERDLLTQMRGDARWMVSQLDDPDHQAVLREYFINGHSAKESCAVLEDVSRPWLQSEIREAIPLFCAIYDRWCRENGKWTAEKQK